MSYTLTVIDMQPYFKAANRIRIRANCIRLIRKAIKDRAAIIFVEYKGYGPTSPLLLNEIKKTSYDRLFTVEKSTDNGGKEIAAIIKRKGLAASKIKVCGVNTDACVHASVLGLKKRLFKTKIEVIADACDSATHFENGHQDGLKKMAQLSNVKIK